MFVFFFDSQPFPSLFSDYKTKKNPLFLLIGSQSLAKEETICIGFLPLNKPPFFAGYAFPLAFPVRMRGKRIVEEGKLIDSEEGTVKSFRSSQIKDFLILLFKAFKLEQFFFERREERRREGCGVSIIGKVGPKSERGGLFKLFNLRGSEGESKKVNCRCFSIHGGSFYFIISMLRGRNFFILKLEEECLLDVSQLVQNFFSLFSILYLKHYHAHKVATIWNERIVSTQFFSNLFFSSLFNHQHFVYLYPNEVVILKDNGSVRTQLLKKFVEFTFLFFFF